MRNILLAAVSAVALLGSTPAQAGPIDKAFLANHLKDGDSSSGYITDGGYTAIWSNGYWVLFSPSMITELYKLPSVDSLTISITNHDPEGKKTAETVYIYAGEAKSSTPIKTINDVITQIKAHPVSAKDVFARTFKESADFKRINR